MKSIVAIVVLLGMGWGTLKSQNLSLKKLDSLSVDFAGGGVFAGSQLRCMGDKVNVRQEADLKGKVVGSIVYGELVELLEVGEGSDDQVVDFATQEWMKVRTLAKTGKPITGYVWGAFLARGAWELSEEGRKTIITLGIPVGPGEKMENATLRLRGYRNLDIPFMKISESKEDGWNGNLNFGVISQEYTGEVQSIWNDALLLGLEWEQCPCGCSGQKHYFVLGSGESTHLITFDIGSYESYRHEVYPLIRAGGEFVGFMYEDYNLDFGSDTGTKEITLHYFSQDEGEVYFESDRIHFKQEYAKDAKGNFKKVGQ